MGAAVPTTQIQPDPDPDSVSVRSVLSARLDDPLWPRVSPSPKKNDELPTPAELRAEAKLQRVQRYQQQERIRAPKVQIDQRVVLWIWIAGILTAFVSSAIVSYNGITAVAEFVGLSDSWMAGLFFFFIELMYLLFLIAYLVLASRTDDEGRKEKTLGAITGMFAFGAIAVAANAFHTFEFWEYEWAEPRMWAGVVLSVSAPLAIISASKMASRVVFAKAIILD
jgi:hypothetical protein